MKFDLNEVAALLHIHKESMGHPRLKPLADAAMKQLEDHAEETAKSLNAAKAAKAEEEAEAATAETETEEEEKLEVEQEPGAAAQRPTVGRRL